MLIAGLGSVAAWPLAARAQRVTTPVIGYLGARASETDVAMLAAVRRGLAEIGYAEGRNVAIEYRFADGQYDRLRQSGRPITMPGRNAICRRGVTSTCGRTASTCRREWKRTPNACSC
jgi:hypothetical protein